MNRNLFDVQKIQSQKNYFAKVKFNFLSILELKIIQYLGKNKILKFFS
jgi:hypothetical protein